MKRNILVVLLLFALAATVNPASALMRQVPFADLTTNAADIVEGTVESQVSYWSDNGYTIFTDVLIRVDDPIAGGLNKGALISLRVEGGMVGDTGITVEHQPHFRQKERVVVFLKQAVPDHPRAVLHLEQGKFMVLQDQVVDFRGERQERGAFKSRIQALVPAQPK